MNDTNYLEYVIGSVTLHALSTYMHGGTCAHVGIQ